MIKFNTLMVIPYNKGIDIDISVMDLPYFKDVYLKSIIIDTQDTFKADGPSSNPVYTLNIEDNTKSLHLLIKDSELLISSMENTIFFVYVTVKGTPSIDTPCGLDNTISVGTCYDKCTIFQRGMKYIQETYNNCKVPRNFIDFILRYKAFEMCLTVKNLPLAITYWKGFIETMFKTDLTKCNCYG